MLAEWNRLIRCDVLELLGVRKIVASCILRYMLKNLNDYVPPEGWKPQRLVKKRLWLNTSALEPKSLHLCTCQLQLIQKKCWQEILCKQLLQLLSERAPVNEGRRLTCQLRILIPYESGSQPVAVSV